MAKKLEEFTIEEMAVMSTFEQTITEAGVFNVLELRTKDMPNSTQYSIRFVNNKFGMRAIETFIGNPNKNVRLYFNKKIIGTDFHSSLLHLNGGKTASSSVKGQLIDYNVVDLLDFTKEFVSVLKEDNALPFVKSRSIGFEGLDLPILETDDEYEPGTSYTWKDVLSIIQEPESQLFKSLSRPGIYLQRSNDGKSRYVGSAYGVGGIIDRWKKHLERGGDAKFLSWYILENGYVSVEFVVLEFMAEEASPEEVIGKENVWKRILSTKSFSYNGTQLNNN